LQLGLSLDKTTIDQLNPYLDSHQNKCILEESPKTQISGPILFFVLDLKELKYVTLFCFGQDPTSLYTPCAAGFA